MGFFIWLFCIRYCAYQGSKRVIGTVDGAIIGALFNIFGVLMVRSSRMLIEDDILVTNTIEAVENNN